MATLDDTEKVFEELDISEYDLRILDPDLPPVSSSMILPKRNCTMMSLDSLSIIISERYSLYIEKDENATAIIEDVSKRLQERITYARSNRMSDEIFILDAILDQVLTMLRKNTLHWDSKAAPLVSKIERGISEEAVQKNKISQVSTESTDPGHRYNQGDDWQGHDRRVRRTRKSNTGNLLY